MTLKEKASFQNSCYSSTGVVFLSLSLPSPSYPSHCQLFLLEQPWNHHRPVPHPPQDSASHPCGQALPLQAHLLPQPHHPQTGLSLNCPCQHLQPHRHLLPLLRPLRLLPVFPAPPPSPHRLPPLSACQLEAPLRWADLSSMQPQRQIPHLEPMPQLHSLPPHLNQKSQRRRSVLRIWNSKQSQEMLNHKPRWDVTSWRWQKKEMRS